MIIPCIDLMGGEVVQLVGGREKALSRPLDETLDAFEDFPLIHVIDLDAAIGTGDNQEIISSILSRRSARIGGGVRSVDVAETLISKGAAQVIVGSAAFGSAGINTEFLGGLVAAVDREKVVVALDTIGGKVAVKGWREVLDIEAAGIIHALEPFCGGFLCTNVDREGRLEGADIDAFLELRAATRLPMTAAGGITTLTEVRVLVQANIQVALGMAIYTGRMDLGDLRGVIGESARAKGKDR